MVRSPNAPAAFGELLHLNDLNPEVRVDAKAKVGAEEAYVLTLAPKTGPTVRLSVSTAAGEPRQGFKPLAIP